MEPERPSFPEIYMTLARALAARSTCAHARVGTVITSVDFRKVLAVGYSGNATGLPNRCDRDLPPAAVRGDVPECGCLHSEENAVIHCDAPRGEPKIVFVTALPCRMCAKRIIQLGGVVDLYYQAAEGEEGAPSTPAPQDAHAAARHAKASRSLKSDPPGTIELLTSVGTRVHRLVGGGV